MREISLDDTDSEECDSGHETRELKTPNIKNIRNHRDTYDDKGGKCPESDRERCFLSEFFTAC